MNEGSLKKHKTITLQIVNYICCLKIGKNLPGFGRLNLLNIRIFFINATHATMDTDIELYEKIYLENTLEKLLLNV